MLNSVSCASAGNCSVGGFYLDGSHNQQAFVVNETQRHLGQRGGGPRHRGLNKGGHAADQLGVVRLGGQLQRRRVLHAAPACRRSLSTRRTAPGATPRRSLAPPRSTRAGTPRSSSVSCASAGNCSAGGDYVDSSGKTQVFVVKETERHLGHRGGGPRHRSPQPGRAGLLEYVSCASAGNCSARRVLHRRFRWSSRRSWSPRPTAPGAPQRRSPARARPGGDAEINSVSWPRQGNCSAGGDYTGVPSGRRSWSTRRTAPGAPPSRSPAAALNQGWTVRAFWARCRAPRRATAAPAGSTAPATTGVRRQRDQRHLGQRRGGPRHRSPQHGRGRRDLLGVVRIGGQLQRRRVLHRQLRDSRRSSPTRPTAPGGGEEVPGTACPQPGRECLDRLGVVRVGGPLQRGRGVHGQF